MFHFKSEQREATVHCKTDGRKPEDIFKQSNPTRSNPLFLLQNQVWRQSVWRVQDKPQTCCARIVFQSFHLSSLLLSTQRSPMLTNPTHKGLRNILREKNGIMWEKFPNWGGGYDPNPLLDVYIPSYFWHAKMILRC